MIQIQRLDGSHRVRIGDRKSNPISADAVAAGRFEALTDPVGDPQAVNPLVRVWVYDIASDRSVEVCPGASAAFALGDFIWWSTGDNETLSWRALDLTTLR